MPRNVMNVDLRHPPEFATPGAEVYAATLEMGRWADANGFSRISIGEHHQNDDGFIPCPLMFAAALGGCTRAITVRVGVVLAPLYDPVRLAEEVAVADLCLGGRLELGLGLGVLRADYEMFGADYERRGAVLEDLIGFLRQAWRGEPMEYRGQTITITPRPVQQPMPIYLGGISRRAADRAVRLADGFHTATPFIWDFYREACLAHGKDDPGPHTPRGPMFLWVTKGDKEQVRRELQPHFDQHAHSYAEQSRKAGLTFAGPFSPPAGAPSPFWIVDPDEAIAVGEGLGSGGELLWHPLLGGIAPAAAFEMLSLVEHEVLPHLRT